MFHQSLAFPGSTRKTKKTKDFGLLRPLLPQDSKIITIVIFWVPPLEMATFCSVAQGIVLPKGPDLEKRCRKSIECMFHRLSC